MKTNFYIILAILICLCFSSYILAQEPGQERPWQNRPRQGNFQDMRNMPMQHPMGGGGNIAMTADATHIYVLMGMTLYKINKATMAVEKTMQLPLPKRPERPERGEGQWQGQGQGQGQGRYRPHMNNNKPEPPEPPEPPEEPEE